MDKVTPLTESEAVEVAKKSVIKMHLMALPTTIVVCLVSAFPPPGITADQIWTCTGRQPEECYRFMLFPIIAAGLMILVMSILLTWRFLEISLNRVFIWIEFVFEVVASIVWTVAIHVVIFPMMKTKFVPLDSNTGEDVKRKVPISWLIATCFMGLAQLIHFIGAALWIVILYRLLLAPRLGTEKKSLHDATQPGLQIPNALKRPEPIATSTPIDAGVP